MTRTVLNLKEMRAKRASDAPVIIDGDGNPHALVALTLDSYLALIDIMQRMQAARADGDDSTENIGKTVGIVNEMMDVVQAILPTFPVRSLELEELLLVVNAIENYMPGAPAVGGAEAGEAVSPESST